MADLRTIRNRARRQLHDRMKLPAYYYETKAKGPAEISVRRHSKPKDIGDIQGTGFRYATTNERETSILFLREECTPIRNSLVCLSAEEMYRVDNVHPPDGITITAEVVALTAVERLDFEFPDSGCDC